MSYLQQATARVVQFRRIDRASPPWYELGQGHCWAPTPTTDPYAGLLHELVSPVGAWKEVTYLRPGWELARARKAIQSSLSRVVEQLTEQSLELGAVLRGLEVIVDSERDRVMARVESNRNFTVDAG